MNLCVMIELILSVRIEIVHLAYFNSESLFYN